MAIGVLAVAARLGLGAVLFAHRRWTGWMAGFVLAVVLVKITVVLAGVGEVDGLAVTRHRQQRAEGGLALRVP
ncbi:hypothetical protein ABZT28_51940, partial [Streptomyces sp. NPDC005388]|uniref:hypothetical protein n=1 Tax=Streptomyces sp. NPDC005388 TaxID=3156717 RepID=UPI0033BD214B